MRIASATARVASLTGLIGALLVGLTGGAAAQARRSEREQVQEAIDRIDSSLRWCENEEDLLNRERAYLKTLLADGKSIIIGFEVVDGKLVFFQFPPAKIDELIDVMALDLLLGGENPDKAHDEARNRLEELSKSYKMRVRGRIDQIDSTIEELIQDRRDFQNERDRLREALAEPIRPAAPPLPPPPRNPYVDLRGTWKPEVGGGVEVVIRGDREGFTVTGTDGHYKHEGTLTSEDGIRYEGEFADLPGWCCGRLGYVWIEVLDDDTYQARSVWWKPGQTTRERPEMTHSWARFKRAN